MIIGSIRIKREDDGEMTEKKNISRKQFLALVLIIPIFTSIILIVFFTFEKQQVGYYIGDFRFYFTDLSRQNYLGVTQGHGTIIMDDNLTGRYAETVCGHEICHHLIDNELLNITVQQEEDICLSVEWHLIFRECQDLLIASNRTSNDLQQSQGER